MAWYRDSFGHDYLKIYSHRDGEEARTHIDFVENVLAPARSAKILDLCCGAGRHLRELSARGYTVVGLDASKVLLETASGGKHAGNGLPGLVRADMRFIPFSIKFDLVLCFFTSFGYFRNEKDNRKVLHAVADSLKTGGRLLLDLLNANELRANLVHEDTGRISDLHVRQKRWIDEDTGRVEKRLFVKKTNGAESTYKESVRIYTLGEITAMINEAGMATTGTFGDFEGTPYRTDSPRMIIVAEKR